MELTCNNGMEDFGCLMQSWGAWLGSFLNTFGDPYTSILFIFLIAVSVLIFGFMIKNAFE